MRQRTWMACMAAAVVLLLHAAAPSAFAADDITVCDIAPSYIEKGETSYTITVQALVKNKGESDDVIIKVAAVDKKGYQLKTLKLNGFVEEGQKKLLIGRLTMNKGTFDQITDWERLQ